MTDNFLNTINKLKAFDFHAAQRDAITHNVDALIDLQRSQFAEGLDRNDNPILLNGRGYAFSTILHKRYFGIGLGRVTDHVTLFQTGQLYKQLFVTITSQNFYFTSRVPYFSRLMGRTGDVTGLDYLSRLEFANNFLLPYVNQELKTKTGLTIKTRPTV